MKKFTLGMVSGMSALALAVPVLAQVTGAQGNGSPTGAVPSVPTQECLQAMTTLDEAHLARFDDMAAMHKQALQDRVAALKTIAAISDEAERQAALGAMHEEMRADKNALHEVPADIQTAMEATRDACGDTFGRRGMGKLHGHKGMMKMKMMPGGMGRMQDIPAHDGTNTQS